MRTTKPCAVCGGIVFVEVPADQPHLLDRIGVTCERCAKTHYRKPRPKPPEREVRLPYADN